MQGRPPPSTAAGKGLNARFLRPAIRQRTFKTLCAELREATANDLAVRAMNCGRLPRADTGSLAPKPEAESAAPCTVRMTLRA